MLLYLYGLKCWQYDSWDGWALTVDSQWKIGVIYHFVVATNEIFEKLKGMAPSDLFFFFWYTIMYSQNFQLKINHYSRRVGPSGVNHWPKGFFQSAATQTWTGEYTQSNRRQALWDQVSNYLANPPGFPLTSLLVLKLDKSKILFILKK